jgi:outer membrane protein OmpA-like peptidoglycan-associated protein
VTAADDQRGVCEASSDSQVSSATKQTETTSSAASTPERYVVFFDADTAMISEAVEAILCQAAMDAKAKNVPKVRIILSADWIAHGDTDDTFADRRAGAVRDVLVGQGVSSGVIEISSNGEPNTLLSVDDDMRELYARRVVVVVDQPHRAPPDNVSLRSSVNM